MDVQNKHFRPEPWEWGSARGHLRRQIAGGTGGQGAIFACGPELEGAVVKLYRVPRPSTDLARVQGLIRTCRGLSPSQPATAEWFKRLNLPMRPILDPSGNFGGVVLPPLPATVNAREHRFDVNSSRFVAESTTVQFEAQFLARKESPLGQTTARWQWRLLTSLAETVALMHSGNLVHGDLSMSNVLALQNGRTHLRDEAYLIDVDDAFLDDGTVQRSSAVRKSRLTYDPFSVSEGQVSKATDVFVVALWAVAYMQYKFSAPELVARDIPMVARMRLQATHTDLPDLIRSALGPIDSRPTMVDLYLGLRAGAKRVGAVK